jgi:hypothetical protein
MSQWAIVGTRKSFSCWLLVRVDGNGPMAIKPTIKKPAIGRVAPKAPKAQSPALAGEISGIHRHTKSRIPNATTRRAIADVKAGRLTRYADEDELFRKLGIKVGKA